MKNELSTVSKEAATAIDVASKTVQRSVKSKRTAYSTKELAEQLKTSKDVILTAARKCLPNKTIEHGKRTFWNDAEATVILDYMKAHPSNNRSVEFNSTVANTTTDLTPALMIKQAMELAQKGYELELARIAAEKESLQVQLDRSKEWYSIKRMEKLNEGQHFDWRVLKNESKKMGVEIKEVFDANYGKVNAYHVSVWESLYFDTLDYGS